MKAVSSPPFSSFSRREPGQGRALALAALVHVLLLSFLWVGIRWQNKPSSAVEAEVWDMTTREAAPLPAPIEAPPEPAREAPSPPQVEELKEDPEIALAQEKKRKLAIQKKEEEQRLTEQKRKLELEQAARKEKLAEQKRKDDKQAAEDARKKQAEQKNALAKEQQARDKIFQENMRRLTGQATAGSGGSGTAAKSTGNNRGDASYVARIAAKVRSNTIFNVVDTGGNNPSVEYRIDLLPDGSLRGAIRKLKSSGVPGFDEAVAKGIEKSAPFPRDKSGEVPPSLELIYKMKEE
ncbi:MAG: cell envelope integrity protein TolA [Burkholderiales bacterium]|nr:cell envelope integrity protein TolA [Burkholderiales bacterium]